MTKGSHRQYKHPTKPGRVTVAGHPSHDLALGTFGSILKQVQLWVVDTWCVALYNEAVIKTFKDDNAQKIYQREHSRKLPSDIQQVALRKLRMINNATSINDLRIPPANRLEKLGGDRTGQWSIRINDQWRICFEWLGSDAYNVEIVDYH